MKPDIGEFKPVGSISSLAATVASLFSVGMPSLASEPPIGPVVDAHRRIGEGEPIERCLIFCPDALGALVWRFSTPHLDTIREFAGLRIPLLSVMPPKTPVCFASMFTGGRPVDHGLTKYERPVLKCDTLFDLLLRAGHRVAIVAVRDSSMDLIFRERVMEYFSERHDGDVAERTVSLIKEDRHSLIVAYQQEYDDMLHKDDPFSDRCLRAVGNHVGSFATMASTALNVWNQYKSAIVFAPDHGAHLDSASGHGDHGLDIPEDMQLFHWYGINRAISVA